MKPQEVRDMSDAELRTREHELIDELFHLRLNRTTSQLPNPMKVRLTRRDLARVKTVLRQRVAGGAPAAAVATPAAPSAGPGRAERRARTAAPRTKTKAKTTTTARPRRQAKGKK